MQSAPYKTAARRTRRTALLGAATAALSLLACGGPPAKAPNPTRPLTERRALDLIASAVSHEGAKPARGRDVVLPGGQTLRVDVALRGRQVCVAYLTDEERVALSDALPASAPGQADALIVLRGSGKESDSRILVLLAKNYLVDDFVGPEHEQTTIAAENKLKRDTRDFLVRAKTQKWP